MNQRVFNTKQELVEALAIRKEKWKTSISNVCSYDEEINNPFRCGNDGMMGVWCSCNGKTTWTQVIEKKTITMPDGTVLPEPVRLALGVGEEYWFSDLVRGKCVQDIWRGDTFEYELLKQGLIHLTKEDAQAWSDYFLSLTKAQR